MKCSFQFNVRNAALNSVSREKIPNSAKGEILFVTARVWPCHSSHYGEMSGVVIAGVYDVVNDHLNFLLPTR